MKNFRLRPPKVLVTRYCLMAVMTLLLTVTFSTNSYSQTGTSRVTGTVVDEKGGAVIGVSVVVDGTSKGTTTGLDGTFALEGVDPASAVLSLSFIGYNTVSETLAGRTNIRVVMSESAQSLDDVVVIGYGSLGRREVSSSIVQINKENFQQGAMGNPMELLTGKVAGLNVNNTASANPNAGSSLQIRGATSVKASNSPLIVIDGVVGGDIRNLAAQDIESMTVLKDAGSAAIYGTRGANGVILITTRKGSGEEGVSRVTYDSWFGINIAKDKPDVLSADEYRRSMRGADLGASTDWYDEILRSFSYDNNQYIGVDGSTKKGYYGASFNYKQATGLDIVSERKEYGGRFVVQQRVLDDWVELNGSLSMRKVKEKWGDEGQFERALNINPTMPIYNEDGSYYQPTSPVEAKNPLSELELNKKGGDRMYVLGSAEAKFHILKSGTHALNTSLSYSLHYNDLKEHNFSPSTSGESFWFGYDGRAKVQYEKWWTNRFEWLANYTFAIPEHTLRFVGGYSYEDINFENVYAENNNFAFDNLLWHNVGAGTYLKDGKAAMGSGKSLAKLIGVFGRVNYNWKDLVFASASFRREGSTKFGEDHKWGNFPAASVAWEMANMDFMSNVGVVNSLKPRFSYGVTGRSDFDSYMSLATYGTKGTYYMDGEWITGYSPSANANPTLGWEKNVAMNIGVDFELWNNRVRGSIDYFDRQSKDLLYDYTAPQPPFVYSNILVNVGTTKNTGFEVAVDVDVFRNTAVKWTTGANFSYGTTKLKKLSNDIYHASYIELYEKPGVGTSEYFFRLEEKSKVGQFYGYKYAGVSDDGRMLVYNKNGEAVPTADVDKSDKRYIGNGAPKSYFSWNNTVSYKNFDLNVFFRGALGFKAFNMRKYQMGLIRCGTENVLRDAYTKNANIYNDGGGVITDFYLERGDYFKLENITLGYNFRPKANKFVENLRVFISGKNLFTVGGYSGNDPSIIEVNGLTPGVDKNNAYPNAAQVSIGLTVRFK